ncbi:hypothetical protein C8246_05985 [Paracidovorax avenae]|nr:hypothetical protein C8246_05985 [Paracidovorax avenae]
MLAARLSCWHRLTGSESDELVALARSWGAPAASGEPVALKPLTEEHEQALALLAGLHPGLTIDGPPMEVATRIFDAVAADRANFEQEIRRQERALESMRAHAWRRP